MDTRELTPAHIETCLYIVPLMLVELREQSGRWEDMPDWEQVSWSADRRPFLNTLEPLLDLAYPAGLMTADQELRCRDLLQGLQPQRPLLERPGLLWPQVSYDVAA